MSPKPLKTSWPPRISGTRARSSTRDHIDEMTFQTLDVWFKFWTSQVFAYPEHRPAVCIQVTHGLPLTIRFLPFKHRLIRATRQLLLAGRRPESLSPRTRQLLLAGRRPESLSPRMVSSLLFPLPSSSVLPFPLSLAFPTSAFLLLTCLCLHFFDQEPARCQVFSWLKNVPSNLGLPSPDPGPLLRLPFPNASALPSRRRLRSHRNFSIPRSDSTLQNAFNFLHLGVHTCSVSSFPRSNDFPRPRARDFCNRGIFIQLDN